MALGKDRPRNWGKGSQIAALNMLLRDRKLAYKMVEHNGVIDLMIAPSNGKITLGFQTLATMEHVSNGLWASKDVFSGEEITTGCSEHEVVRKTIMMRCA
jgi:hypothetical protein